MTYFTLNYTKLQSLGPGRFCVSKNAPGPLFVNFGNLPPPLTGGDEMIIDAPAVDWLTLQLMKMIIIWVGKIGKESSQESKKQAKFACMTGNG